MTLSRWQCCVLHVSTYREGSGGPTRELLELTRPGANAVSVTHPLGSVGMLNHLGADGWELVDVEGGQYFLKRPDSGTAAE